MGTFSPLKVDLVLKTDLVKRSKQEFVQNNINYFRNRAMGNYKRRGVNKD